MRSRSFLAFTNFRSAVAAFARDDQGSATLWNVTWLLVFAGMAGLSIDSSNGYRMKAIMQSTADAAVLAAAYELGATGVQADAITEAKVYAVKNMPGGTYGTVLVDEDVTFGHWDAETKGVEPYTARWTPVDKDGAIPGGLEVNAVRVILRRTWGSGNPLPTQVLGIVGLNGWDLNTQAVAIFVDGDDCLNNGFISGGRFVAQSDNDWLGGICIHGEQRVELGGNNYGDETVLISTPDKSGDHFKLGGGGSGLLEGGIEHVRTEHVQELSQVPLYPDMIPDLYNQLKDWTLGDPWPAELALPFTPTSVVTGASDVKKPTEGTVYISSGTIKFSDVDTLQNVAAISGESVLVDSSVTTVRNAVFLAHSHKSDGYHDGNIEFTSNTQVGDVDYCGSKQGWVRAWAGKEVKIQSNARMNGVQIVAGENAYVGSGGVSSNGIAVQVGSETYRSEEDKAKIEPASNGSFGGCAAHFVAAGAKKYALVY